MKTKNLPQDYLEALDKARTTIRKESVDFIEGEIQSIYAIGEHPTTKEDIQPAEIVVKEGTKKVMRNYIFVGADTIKSIFGEPDEDGLLSNIEYEDGIPKKLSVPDVTPNAQNQYWFSLPKK